MQSCILDLECPDIQAWSASEYLSIRTQTTILQCLSSFLQLPASQLKPLQDYIPSPTLHKTSSVDLRL